MVSLLTTLTRQSAGVRYPKWISGRYYSTHAYIGGAASSSAVTANTIYSSPLWVPPGGVIAAISINVSGAAAAGKLLRYTLHAPNAADLPGGLLLDAGTILADATGDREITIAYTPPPGLIWVSVVSDGAPTIALFGTTGLTGVGGATTASGVATGSPNRAQGDALAHDPWGTPGGYLTGGYVAVAVKAA